MQQTQIRVIDSKYHIDSDGNIVKTSNGHVIPADEPLILFRARDRLAIRALAAYYLACVEDGAVEEHTSGVGSMIDAFNKFAREHPEQMKQPGITRGK